MMAKVGARPTNTTKNHRHGQEIEMYADSLVGLLSVLDVLRPAFTEPSFRNLLVLFCGWVLTQGPHAVTQALVFTGIPGRKHHEAFHRFFSRGTWSPDRVGRWLFVSICARLLPPDAPIGAGVDDTLASKKGADVFGIGSHLDPVRSTKAHRVFAFGHVWVVVGVIVCLPFSSRPWTLPVLFRLYRGKKECKKNGGIYRKKTELALEMITILASWAPERQFELVADSAYSNATVLKRLPPNVMFFGDMRPDAVLTRQPGRRRGNGRRPRRGAKLPKPVVLAADKRRPWKQCEIRLYGKVRTIHYKTVDAQWYRAFGAGLLRIVVVRVDSGKDGIRVFFSTDTDRSPEDILATYSRRWSIEVCFRDMKQHLGFSDSSARKKKAVERTAPFVGYIYTCLVLWFSSGVWQTLLATPPLRPWYPHKKGLCFADIIRAAQRILIHVDVLDLTRSIGNLRDSIDSRAHAKNPKPTGLDRAA